MGGLRWISCVLYLPIFGLLIACSPAGFTRSRCPTFDYGLPPGQSPPPAPPDVCVSKATVELGRALFYSKELSANRSMSCGACHQQSRAFSDGRVRAIGSTGQLHPRNTQSLANVGYLQQLTWALPELTRLDKQAGIPFFSKSTATGIEELNMAGKEHIFADRMRSEPRLQALFAAAFPGQTIDVIHMALALAAFESTLISRRSPFDREELSKQALRGKELFFSQRVGCSGCHSGTDFNQDAASNTTGYYNIGLYNVGNSGDYPDHRLHGPTAARLTQGLQQFSGRAADRGRFRTPSLRNVALTAPYMHDGSIATLSLAIDHFDGGGRMLADGPFAGDGRRNPNKDSRIRRLGLNAAEKAQLAAFLMSLSDDCFINDPRYSDPLQPPPALPAHCRLP